MKVKMFEKKDLFYYVPATVMTLVAILGSINTGTSQGPWPLIMLWGIALVLWAIAAFMLYSHWRDLKAIDFVTKHGIQVDTANFIISEFEFTTAVDNFILLWTQKCSHIPVSGYLKDLYLVFREHPFKTPDGQQVVGLCWPTKGKIELSWMPRLEDTALFHELGHWVYYKYTGNVLETTYLTFAKEVGVP